MRHHGFWSVSALALAASAVLAACGGDILAAVAFIGSAGGDWRVDDDSSQPGLQPRSGCGDPNGCKVNISAAGGNNFYAKAFDVNYTGNIAPGCASTQNVLVGRIDGKRISLPNCFSGEYVTINEARSDDGTLRMFFDFTPPLDEGVWVEIEDERRRFKFDSSGVGCEFGAAGTPRVDVVVSSADVVNGPFETTIASFTVTGDAGGAWSGRFVGISGMKLTRGNAVLELERRNQAASPACP